MDSDQDEPMVDFECNYVSVSPACMTLASRIPFKPALSTSYTQQRKVTEGTRGTREAASQRSWAKQEEPNFPEGATFTAADLEQFSRGLNSADRRWFDTLKPQLLDQPVPVPDELDWKHSAGFSLQKWKLSMLKEQLWA